MSALASQDGREERTISAITALAAATAEMPAIRKDRTNPHFKSAYASLDTIIDTVTPVLQRHGLVWYSLPSVNEKTGAPELIYVLAHTGGTQLSGTMPLMIGGGSAQNYGSALSYARRYAITAVLNLATEDDDDGNQASRSSDYGQPRPQPQTTVDMTEEIAGLHPEQLRHILTYFNLFTHEAEIKSDEQIPYLFKRIPGPFEGGVSEAIAKTRAAT